MHSSTRFPRIPGSVIRQHSGRVRRGGGLAREKHTAEDRKLLRLIAKLKAELQVG